MSSTLTSASSYSVSRCGLTRTELKEFRWVTKEGHCKALCADGSKCGDPYAKHAAAGPALPSSPNSKSSSQLSSPDRSGEFSLKIHSPDVDGRTINIEVINRPPSKHSQQRRVQSADGNAEMDARLRKLETQLEAERQQLQAERQQRDALETELKQVMAQLRLKDQTLAFAQKATPVDQGNTSNQQVTHDTAKQEQKHGSSLISRFRAAWRSSSHRGSSHTRHASSPTSRPLVPSEAATTASSMLPESSPPTTPPHPRTNSTFSSPLSAQPMSPGTTVTASSSSPQCPVCHEPIDDDLYIMVECEHLFHLACARFVWNRQHRREETPYCVFPGCGEPVKHSPTKRLARIVEESSSRSNSDISDPSHRSIGQTNPSFDRQSIGSQDTVVSQATSTESNQSQPQPLTNVTHNTVAFSSSSSSSSNSASTSTSTSASTQEHKQPPTMVASTGSVPASSSDA